MLSVSIQAFLIVMALRVLHQEDPFMVVLLSAVPKAILVTSLQTIVVRHLVLAHPLLLCPPIVSQIRTVQIPPYLFVINLLPSQLVSHRASVANTFVHNFIDIPFVNLQLEKQLVL